MMKRLRTLLGIGLGLAIVAGAGWYISQIGTTPAPRQGAGRFGTGMPTPVGIATAAKGEVPVVIRALGTVAPLHTVNVKTQITGQLLKVDFKEGQMVKQGDLLALVDHQGSLILADQRLLGVELLAGDRILGDQLAVALEVGLGVLEQRLVLLLLADRLLQGDVVGPRIDQGQNVALLHHLAFLEVDLEELAGDLRLDVDRVQRRDRSERPDDDGDLTLGGGRNPHRSRHVGEPVGLTGRRRTSALRNIPAGTRHNGEPQADPEQGPQPFHLPIRPKVKPAS